MKKIDKEIFPGITLIDNYIDNCEELLHLANKKGEEEGWPDAVVTRRGQPYEVDTKAREAYVLDVAPSFKNDVEWFSLAKKIWLAADAYARKHNITFSNMEPQQLLRYRIGSGHYEPHYDCSIIDPRIFSIVLYLNDVEEGGETRFVNFDIDVKPKAGRIIIFPANYAFLHSALPPISNEKFAVVTWFNP